MRKHRNNEFFLSPNLSSWNRVNGIAFPTALRGRKSIINYANEIFNVRIVDYSMMVHCKGTTLLRGVVSEKYRKVPYVGGVLCERRGVLESRCVGVVVSEILGGALCDI